MIVLRLTVAGQAHDVTLRKTEAVLGASPTADVTLQHAGWTDLMARCRRTDHGLVIERADTGTRILLTAGQCMALGDAILEWVPPEPTLPDGTLFGAYEDDPSARPRSSIAAATFAIEESPSAAPPAPPTPAPPTPAPSIPAPPSPAPAASAQRQAAAPPPDPGPILAAAPEPAAAQPPASSPPKPDHPTPVGFPEPDLASELVATLKRAPFFVASSVVHLAVFFLLTILWDTSQEPEPTGLGTLRSSLAEPDQALGDFEQEDALDVAQMDFASPDLDELLEMPKPEPAKSPEPDEKILEAEMDEQSLDAMATPDIGVLPSDAVFRGKTPKRFKPQMAPAKLAEVFDGGGASRVNRNVAELVREMVGGRGGQRGAGLDDLEMGDLLVVAGTFDHIEKVLKSLRLPFKKVAPYDLAEGKVDFNKHKVVFWNCGKPVGARAMRTIKRPLQKFVRRGGYLFTTDWAIGGVLRDVFPGYLQTKGRKLGLPERVVDIQPVQTSRRSPLLEGVFLPGAKGRWWLEDQSFDIIIGPRAKDTAEILIEAPELRDVWNINAAVAVTFTYGRGRVLHVMGHYFQQAGNVAGTFAAHRLAMNFVLQRMELARVK